MPYYKAPQSATKNSLVCTFTGALSCTQVWFDLIAGTFLLQLSCPSWQVHLCKSILWQYKLLIRYSSECPILFWSSRLAVRRSEWRPSFPLCLVTCTLSFEDKQAPSVRPVTVSFKKQDGNECQNLLGKSFWAVLVPQSKYLFMKQASF